jgi:cell division transport system ATP-binding protein
LVADEPTGNLDPINTWEIIRLLLKINELGTAVILSTHDKEIVNTLGRRVITLENGLIVRDEEKGKYIL